MDLEWCRQPEIGLPKPDAVLYLTLSAEEAAKRTEFGGERYEQTDFQRKVGDNYQLLKENDWKARLLVALICDITCKDSGKMSETFLKQLCRTNAREVF